MQAFELKFIVRIESIFDWVLSVFLFLLDGLNVLIKLISLVLFEFFQLTWALHHHNEFASERRNLNFLTRVENEMHDTAVSAFNQTRLFSANLLRDHLVLDSRFCSAKFIQLFSNDSVKKRVCVLCFLGVSQYRAQELVLESHCQLIFETVTPEGMFGQLGHRAIETASKELLRNVEAL